MGLCAILTIGWPENRGTPILSAPGLADGREVDVRQFQDRLRAALAETRSLDSKAVVVTTCDRLFRRRSRGFKRIQAFLDE